MITTPLAGKVALITGSARNMGRAFAVALAFASARMSSCITMPLLPRCGADTPCSGIG